MSMNNQPEKICIMCGGKFIPMLSLYPTICNKDECIRGIEQCPKCGSNNTKTEHRDGFGGAALYLVCLSCDTITLIYEISR
jgi:hypothetical protein